MLVLPIVTVLQFCKLRYEMLVSPINPSLWYHVKDNVFLQALCPSSNCLYTKSKSRMLRPLKVELRYELSRSKWLNSDSSSSGFLLPNWLNSLMVLLKRPFSYLFIADNVITFRCSSVIYPIYRSHLLISITLVHVFNRESKWDTSLGFLRERFSKTIENNNHNRTIYRNDNMASLVKTY